MSIIDNDKHTPGPWVSHAEVAGVIYGPDGHQVCTTPRTTRREVERAANARLITAAPEMLEALRAIVYRPRTSRPRKDDNAARDIAVSALDQITRLRGDLEDAIDRATGREVTS